MLLSQMGGNVAVKSYSNTLLLMMLGFSASFELYVGS